jgi:hypothetical protein
MTEFKKGDRIVFTKADAWGKRGERVRMPKGTLGTYDDADGGAAPWVRLDTGERVRAWVDALAPAALDPAWVFPGDTVTLEKDGGKYEGAVAALTADGMGRLMWVVMGGIQFHMEGPDAWALTAHQPAPEPEPEWKPGTFVSGEFEGRRGQGVVTEQGEFLFWNHTGGHMQEEPLSTITDVRPLAVIDPADVDVVALQREIDDAMPGHEASVVLERLGLNR